MFDPWQKCVTCLASFKSYICLLMTFACLVEGTSAPPTSTRAKEPWAFKPIIKPIVPNLPHQAWTQNPIDHFILKKLNEVGLKPSPSATATTLLRRLALDLNGTIPSVDQLDQFVREIRNGQSDSAYRRWVERLLSSERYGERMAWEWLEAARYADSNGYQGDSERTMWPWRDWVVSAFNRNLPFDVFSTYQIAGDLAPSPSQEQILATGFLRNHMINLLQSNNILFLEPFQGNKLSSSPYSCMSNS